MKENKSEKLSDFLGNHLWKAGVLEKYEKIFYKDKDLAKIRAIVGHIYIQLENYLNLTISAIFLRNNLHNERLMTLFESQILDKVNISRKITIVEKSEKFDKKIINKIRKINDLRNSLLHFMKKQPLYGKQNLADNSNAIETVVNDYLEIADHFTDYWKKLKLVK